MSAPSCACAKTYNLQVEQGATLSSQITLKLDGAPVDITGAEFQFTGKLDPNLPDSDPSVVTVDWTETTTPTIGVTWLVIPAATTVNMEIDAYAYQVRMVGSGGVVTPLFGGTLTITQPVSPRSS